MSAAAFPKVVSDDERSEHKSSPLKRRRKSPKGPPRSKPKKKKSTKQKAPDSANTARAEAAAPKVPEEPKEEATAERPLHNSTAKDPDGDDSRAAKLQKLRELMQKKAQLDAARKAKAEKGTLAGSTSRPPGEVPSAGGSQQVSAATGAVPPRVQKGVPLTAGQMQQQLQYLQYLQAIQHSRPTTSRRVVLKTGASEGVVLVRTQGGLHQVGPWCLEWHGTPPFATQYLECTGRRSVGSDVCVVHACSTVFPTGRRAGPCSGVVNSI